MPDYHDIFTMACERKGGEKALRRLLQKPASKASLRKLGDDRYLAEFSRKVFQSGFVWRVVELKWDNFEDLFWGFDIDKLLMMPDDMLERKASNKRIIRNHRKVLAIRDNALMIADTRRSHGGTFGEFIADWPVADIVGLWSYLKKHGTRLGGNTGPYALRSLGKDTFLLTRDVEGFLRLHNIITTGVNTRSALSAAQDWFNHRHDESGKSLTELSQIVSFCFGDNRVGVNPH